MPGSNYIVLSHMRPPVAIDEDGITPIRTRRALQIFKFAVGSMTDRSGIKILRQQIIKRQTDDGLLADLKWDNRHHVAASNFNSQNKSYFKVLHYHLMLTLGIF